MEKILVTGGAGFIGSNLTKYLLKDNNEVMVFDKLPEDKIPRLESILSKITYKKIDLKDFDSLKNEMKNIDTVAHFSASADIALGKENTRTDFNEGILTTFNILETMRINGVKKIIFPSSSTIYGDFSKIPTPEDAGLLFPTSLYGAAKLSSEGLISAFCHLFNMKSWIFRFGNVVGSDMTRGVIKDFIKKLKDDPTKLHILGDGNQKKDFIHIDDCVEAMLFAYKNSNETINVFNLGTGSTTSVNDIAKTIVESMHFNNVKFSYSGGKSGWPGDAPVVHYDISKIKKLGWIPKMDSDKAVRKSIIDTIKNEVN